MLCEPVQNHQWSPRRSRLTARASGGSQQRWATARRRPTSLSVALPVHSAQTRPPVPVPLLYVEFFESTSMVRCNKAESRVPAVFLWVMLGQTPCCCQRRVSNVATSVFLTLKNLYARCWGGSVGSFPCHLVVRWLCLCLSEPPAAVEASQKAPCSPLAHLDTRLLELVYVSPCPYRMVNT